MPDGRTRRLRRLGAALCASALIVLAFPPGSGHADPRPSIEEVQYQVERLNHEAEQASERLNTVRVRLEQTRERLASVRADFSRQQTRVTDLRGQLSAAAVAQFEDRGLGLTAQLLGSDDPRQLLSQLAALESVNASRAVLLDAYLQERRLLAAQHTRLDAETDRMAAMKAQAAREKATLDKKVAEAEALLAQLREEQRQRLAEQRRQERLAAMAAASRAEERAEEPAPAAPAPAPASAPAAPAPAPAPVPASGGAATAVAFALAQIGDPYSYGAAGPDAWDCSGLTMGAWAAAGVSLPHSSSMQASSGTPVSTAALQPGDLVFYYSPISHVGLYIGGGQIVHAPNSSSYVQVVSVDSMPIAAAVRPG